MNMNFFKWDHLPPHLQLISKNIGMVANRMNSMLSYSEEKEAGMRKLLEAKDCFVRAQLESLENKKELENIGENNDE